MYDVLVYDEEHGQYVPAKDTLTGRRVSCESWAEAAEKVFQFTRDDPSKQSDYKVHFRTVRRGKVRR